jgi:hypothetical protein
VVAFIGAKDFDASFPQEDFASVPIDLLDVLLDRVKHAHAQTTLHPFRAHGFWLHVRNVDLHQKANG